MALQKKNNMKNKKYKENCVLISSFFIERVVTFVFDKGCSIS